MFGRYLEDPVARSMIREHSDSCRVDKEDIKRELRDQRSSMDAKHGENQKALGEIKRYIYIAMGLGLGAQLLLQHGTEALSKFTGHG